MSFRKLQAQSATIQMSGIIRLSVITNKINGLTE